ncbi:hypothetical protein MBGDN05_00862, partial [Thermoplasmatales archaeon SCGC AB-539-N05]
YFTLNVSIKQLTSVFGGNEKEKKERVFRVLVHSSSGHSPKINI